MRIKINGKGKVALDTHFRGGWGDYSEIEILELNDDVKKYKIEIDVIKEEGAKEITILGFLVS